MKSAVKLIDTPWFREVDVLDVALVSDASLEENISGLGPQRDEADSLVNYDLGDPQLSQQQPLPESLLITFGTCLPAQIRRTLYESVRKKLYVHFPETSQYIFGYSDPDTALNILIFCSRQRNSLTVCKTWLSNDGRMPLLQ